MRKTQKRKIEETLTLMGKVHEEIRHQMTEGRRENVLQLLQDCQEGAIQAGNLIEQAEGEEAPSIRPIEAYCETCYRIYESVRQGEPQNPSGVYRLLQKGLAAMDSSVRQTVPVRLEIAFFCYKASMSDCLESIYFAAKEDPSCDVYFVPIPYYDRNPNGALGKMHYEGEECYPDTYQLTDWREYDVEARRPDIIYIMNPYDGQNRVTSVHPAYYAERLRKLTDCLVYVPYYISAGKTGPGMTGGTPGVRFSDCAVRKAQGCMCGGFPEIQQCGRRDAEDSAGKDHTHGIAEAGQAGEQQERGLSPAGGMGEAYHRFPESG